MSIGLAVYKAVKQSIEDTWLLTQTTCDEVFYKGKWYYVRYTINEYGEADIAYIKENS